MGTDLTRHSAASAVQCIFKKIKTKAWQGRLDSTEIKVQRSKELYKMTEEPEAFRDSRLTAEISNRMRVPDRIVFAGEAQTHSPAFVGGNGSMPVSFNREREGSNDKFEMQVPERILVAGRDQHMSGNKSTPFEMQVENAVLPPTRNEVRVNTPPRNIRLDDHNFPNAQIEEDEGTVEELYDNLNDNQGSNSSRPSTGGGVSFKGVLAGKIAPNRSASVESESCNLGIGRQASEPSNLSMMDTIHGGSGHSINPWEEIQIVRRQIAKLNHRLMAVELENQQQQQRELILTVFVTSYFVGKFFMWLNRSP